ncbi:hypothetical protein ACILE2_08945 [Capnocytophaga canimorsus]|uniref:hypothetical protein n=1 Tax=Capnocytophaga canimorsus TaxID=28188 RepID=UPI0037D33B58
MNKCVCSELPSIIEGSSMGDFKGKICFVEIEFIPKEWTTIYECKCCNEIWKEIYREVGHGEIPFLFKISNLSNENNFS